MKFSEGEIHNFRVLKIVELPDEGKFFVLKHPSGRRLLLPAQNYIHYQIDAGKELSCRIDRVNCTGNVFLEPQHPVYLEGSTYPFKIIQPIDINGSLLVVTDCFNNNLRVFLSSEQLREIMASGNDLISLRVVRIKKGKPVVTLSNDYIEKLQVHVGEIHKFIIESIEVNNFSDEVFVLKSGGLPRAELKTRHYSHFGYKIGDSVTASVIKINDDATLKVEPENPFYKKDEVYEFRIDDIEQSESSMDPVLIVYDSITKNIGIPITKQQKNCLKNETRVLCRVIGFRKGKPRLEMV